MRLMVFFDLPTTGPKDKRNYILFRRFLLKDGYDMIQWSVYARLTNGVEDQKKHMKRLQAHLPPTGSVRCLTVSEKQFVGMAFLVGPKKASESHESGGQIVLF